MTIQPSPGTDDSSLDDAARHSEDQNSAGANHEDASPDEDGGEPSGGGQISEAGGASLNAETSAGGADAVPDTHG